MVTHQTNGENHIRCHPVGQTTQTLFKQEPGYQNNFSVSQGSWSLDSMKRTFDVLHRFVYKNIFK